MSKEKRARLRRLVRVTELIYRKEAAELARKQLDAREAGEVAVEAEGRLDAPLQGGDFLSQLALVRAARARQQLEEANSRVYVQLDSTKDAMSKKKGAESELESHAWENKRRLAAQDAEEVLERIGRSQTSSFG